MDAHLIGRTWYVNQDELSTHRVEKKRMSRVKAREQAKKSIEAQRVKVQSETKKTIENIDIRYEQDDADLIPKTRKVSVVSDSHKKNESHPEPVRETEEVIENIGEKVLMQGSIPVIDVTDAATDPDAIVLTPTRIRKDVSVHENTTDMPLKVSVESASLRSIPVSIDTDRKAITFAERSAVYNDEGTEKGVMTSSHEELVAPKAVAPHVRSDISIRTMLLSIVCVFGFVCAITMLSLRMQYTVESGAQFSFHFSSSDTLDIFRLKI